MTSIDKDDVTDAAAAVPAVGIINARKCMLMLPLPLRTPPPMVPTTVAMSPFPLVRTASQRVPMRWLQNESVATVLARLHSTRTAARWVPAAMPLVWALRHCSLASTSSDYAAIGYG